MAKGEPKEKAGAKVVVLLLLGLSVLFGGAYALAAYAAGDNVPRGTSVAGVDIGGQPRDKAVRILTDGLSARAEEPIRVSVDDAVQTVDPADVGLSVDYAASVAKARGGNNWNPRTLWNYYTGGSEIEPVKTVDEAALSTFVATLDETDGRPPVEGAVAFKDGEIKTTKPERGKSFDAEAVKSALTAAYLEAGALARVEAEVTDPDIDEADVQQALTDFANPAVSGPVDIAFGEAKVKLEVSDFTPALSMAPEGGVLVPKLDAEKLLAAVDAKVSSVDAPVDATVQLVDGKPTVIPAKPGVSFDEQQVSEGFLGVVTQEAPRRLEVEAVTAEPEFTTKDARALKIKEKVSSFTTYFPYAEYRNTNIGRAAELVNGTVLKPGETFSLNDTVGERTVANGFTDGFIISNGIFKEDLGGGVSQMATTTFNAMFFAGLQDVEHKPHSFYIDRYPVGREATVAWGSVDLRFKNDTPYGVLIQASVTPSTPSSQGVVTVSMYSTKYWDITSSTSDRYNFTEPKTRTLTTEDCYPNTGYQGFDVDVTRYFKKPGSSTLDHSEKFHTTYTPSDTVICKKPEASPTAAPSN